MSGEKQIIKTKCNIAFSLLFSISKLIFIFIYLLFRY